MQAPSPPPTHTHKICLLKVIGCTFRLRRCHAQAFSGSSQVWLVSSCLVCVEKHSVLLETPFQFKLSALACLLSPGMSFVSSSLQHSSLKMVPEDKGHLCPQPPFCLMPSEHHRDSCHAVSERAQATVIRSMCSPGSVAYVHVISVLCPAFSRVCNGSTG